MSTVKGARGAPAVMYRALPLVWALSVFAVAAEQAAPISCEVLRRELAAFTSQSLGSGNEPGFELACQTVALKLAEARSKNVPLALLRPKLETMVRYICAFRDHAVSNGDGALASLVLQRPVYGTLADFAASAAPYRHFHALLECRGKNFPGESATFFAACDAYLLSVSYGVSRDLALESVLHLASRSELRPALVWLDSFYTHAETHQLPPDRAARVLLGLSGPISNKRLVQAVDDFR